MVRKTRVVSQDMKTGEFAYLDQLIQDGYYPNLWILPKNYDPPQQTGETIRLPLVPIINVSPPNITDTVVIALNSQVNPDNGMGVGLPRIVTQVGRVRPVVF